MEAAIERMYEIKKKKGHFSVFYEYALSTLWSVFCLSRYYSFNLHLRRKESFSNPPASPFLVCLSVRDVWNDSCPDQRTIFLTHDPSFSCLLSFLSRHAKCDDFLSLVICHQPYPDFTMQP